MTATLDVRTDDGLRRTLRELGEVGSWDTPAGLNLLAEIRRRAARNAAHAADARNDRSFVDDIVAAAWLVLHRFEKKVVAATRPWAYLMSSAQRQAFEELRAQQLLARPTKMRGRGRHMLPRRVTPIGSSAADLAAAFRHETTGPGDNGHRTPVTWQHAPEQRLIVGPEAGTDPHGSAPWLTAFVDLLVSHGADDAVSLAAIDRLADLCLVTRPSYWEHAARRDPILARLGLTPDQFSALVALLAGSRATRRTRVCDSLLSAVRTSVDTGGQDVQLTRPQQRRIATFTARGEGQHQPLHSSRAA